MKNNVRQIRDARRMTQSELATLVGVQVQTIWNIENARHKPRAKTVRKLAEALGVTAEQLFEDDEKKPAA